MDTARLTLGAILAAAERASPRVEATRASARAAAARVGVAMRRPDPEVQFGLMNFEIPRVRPMPAVGMVQVQVMQMIPLGGKLRLGGEVASARADAATHRIEEAVVEVRARTAEAFYELYAADMTLTVARESKRLVTDLVAIARRMYEVGEGRQADVLRASVELARMDEEVVRIETMQTVYRTRLNALLGRAPDAPIGVPLLPSFATDPLPLDSLVRIAESNRPMIRAGLQETRAASLASELARRESRPDFQVGFQLGVLPTAAMPGMEDNQLMASIMVGTTIPFFGKRGLAAMRDETAAMRAMADADVGAMRLETRGAVAEVYADLLRARRLAAHHRSSILPQAEANVASALAAYRASTVDFSTMLDAQVALSKFRMELYMLDAEQGKAWAELEMLTGQRLIDVDATRPSREPFGGSSND
ncbi:MAG TPA: TolC family protein [Gemmatimonadaceae bacterium]|nr:TolC family protein [Gemmatimonadaceae bacterium]